MQGREAEHEYRAIHARFARNVVAIYGGAAVIGIGALVASLVTDLNYQRAEARRGVFVETELRAQYLGHHLTLPADEVQRLSERPEINLLDTEMEPEQRLLSSSHANSTVFNRGMALLDRNGTLVWAAPEEFLEDSTHPIPDTLLQQLATQTGAQIIPSPVDSPHETVLYVAMPIHQERQVTGILIGAIDLVAAGVVDTGFNRRAGSEVLLATSGGQLLFPPEDRSDTQLVHFVRSQVSGATSSLSDADFRQPVVVASSPVPNTDFILMTVVDAAALDAPTWRRLTTRLLAGIGLAALPLVVLSLLLRGSFRAFRVAEEEAITAERMQSLGEAASLIAHEVRNALNGLRLGLDVVLASDGGDRSGRRAAILNSLRGEMQRLSDFTTELLTFSRGVAPQVRPLELGGFVEKVVAVLAAEANERGVHLAAQIHDAPLAVHADPTLIHVVISNLIGNAIHFAGHQAPPVVRVEALRAGDNCAVRVVDNGPGVAPNIRRRLFEPFVTGRSNGVGIGLALARRIARAHGGELREVTRADGPCFELTIPAAVS